MFRVYVRFGSLLFVYCGYFVLLWCDVVWFTCLFVGFLLGLVVCFDCFVLFVCC